MIAAILRDLDESDWPAILELANRSVAAVPGAGAQDMWLKNRRSFDALAGIQRHWVAEEEDVVVGYAGIESRSSEDRKSFRVFVVTEPERRAILGHQLMERALAELAQLAARNASFTEYAQDTEFIKFLRQHRFEETNRLELEAGGEVVVLSRSLDAN